MKFKSRNTLNVLVVLTVLLIILGCVCPNDRTDGTDTNSPAANEQTSDDSDETKPGKEPDKGDFIVRQTSVADPRYESLDRSLKESKVLEKAADKLNRSLSLPHDITLQTKDCGQVNAFYDPQDKSITFCYELMEHFFQLYRSDGDSVDEANKRMNEAVTFIFLHELGHALIDSYDLPITANQEDAADRCSSYICIEELGEDGVQAILSAADAFAIESKDRTPNQRSMADEHLLQEQRFFNSLCMVYGSNQGKYSYIVEKGYLPKERAVRCPSEYDQTARAWVKLLEPWRKD
ncbi:MAG: DUF4344 domain-containing metallopeptidase [Aridibacter sp.]